MFKDDSSNVTPSEVGSQNKNKGQRRLERLRRLFPNLIPKLLNLTSISVAEALRIGGWVNKDTMAADLDEAEMHAQS